MIKVSVIMAIFGDVDYLRSSISSILNQTYRDFELIIIKDNCGTTSTDDKIDEVIASFSDARIKYIINKVRLGFVDSLNLGLSLAKGEYIARMDSDDFCFSNRIETQVKYLDEHEDISIIGSSYIRINADNKVIDYCALPVSDKDIKETMIFKDPMCHPSVMVRSSLLKDCNLGYKKIGNKGFAEDYILWSDIMHYASFYNMEEPLLFYRVSTQSRSQDGVKHTEELLQIAKYVIKNVFRYHRVTETFDADEVCRYLFNLFEKGSPTGREVSTKFREIYELLVKPGKVNEMIIKENLGYIMIRTYRKWGDLRLSVYGVLHALKLFGQKKKCNKIIYQELLDGMMQSYNCEHMKK